MLDDNWQFLGTDYHGETEITKEDDGKTVNLVLHEVNYSESICIQAEKGKYEIVYDANGGQNISGDSDRVSICYRGTHQRINTSTGTDLLPEMDTHCLDGIPEPMEPDRQWGSEAGPNGKKDLCCMHNGFPDRRGRFCIQKVSGFAVITSYIGKAQQICVPSSLEVFQCEPSGNRLLQTQSAKP